MEAAGSQCLLLTGFFRDQVAKRMKNFENNVVDTWNEKDRYEYILAAKYKIVLADVGGAPPMNVNSQVFPLTVPTSPITEGTMRTIRTRLLGFRGAGEYIGSGALPSTFVK